MRGPKARHWKEQEETVSQVHRQIMVSRKLAFERMTCSCSCLRVIVRTADAAFFCSCLYLAGASGRKRPAVRQSQEALQPGESRAVSASTTAVFALGENLPKRKIYMVKYITVTSYAKEVWRLLAALERKPRLGATAWSLESSKNRGSSDRDRRLAGSSTSNPPSSPNQCHQTFYGLTSVRLHCAPPLTIMSLPKY